MYFHVWEALSERGSVVSAITPNINSKISLSGISTQAPPKKSYFIYRVILQISLPLIDGEFPLKPGETSSKLSSQKICYLNHDGRQ